MGGRKEPAEAAKLREGRTVGRGQASARTAKSGHSACQGLTLYWCEKTSQHPHSLPPPETAALGCPLPAGGHSLAPRRKLTGLLGYFES